MSKPSRWVQRFTLLSFLCLIGPQAAISQQNPAIDVEKSTNGHDADAAPGPTIKAGEPIKWTYRVANIGDVRLSNIQVSDDRGVAVSCPKSSLDPGESMSCTGSGLATAGQYANLGTARGTGPDGLEVSDTDPSHYWGRGATLKLIKHVVNDDGGTAQVSDFLLFVDSQKVMSGVATELFPGSYTASEQNVVGYVASPWTGDCAGDGTVTLAAGDSKVCEITNNDASVRIDVEKSTNGHDADAAPGPTIKAGEPIKWTYRVANIGDVRLSNIQVSDDRGVAVSCPKSSLDPGESMSCTGSGLATAGQYANLGTARGTGPDGLEVSDTDPSHYNGEVTNNPPEAYCRNVRVPVDQTRCNAEASIDDGSFDPDGDSITLTQAPPPPYSLGTTEVELTASDGSLEDSCAGTVTIVDEASPIVWCDAPATVTPRDAPVTFTAVAEDNCRLRRVRVVRPVCFKVNRSGKRVRVPCRVQLRGPNFTIRRTGGVGTHIRWLAVAVDRSSNRIVRRCEVVVVRPSGRRDDGDSDSDD